MPFWKSKFTVYDLKVFGFLSAGKQKVCYSKAVVWNKATAGSLKKCEIQKKILIINSTAKILSLICMQKKVYVCRDKFYQQQVFVRLDRILLRIFPPLSKMQSVMATVHLLLQFFGFIGTVIYGKTWVFSLPSFVVMFSFHNDPSFTVRKGLQEIKM